MLAGVGGCTVSEARERLSYDEVLSWAAYMKKRGSLHVGMRLEFGFALIAQIINRALGGSSSIEDYMPHADREGRLEDVMQILAGGRRG